MPGTGTNIVRCSSTLFLVMNAWCVAKSSSIAPALLAHVGNSVTCRNAYLACFVPASEEEVQRLEDEDRETYRTLKSQGWNLSKEFLPMTRVCGPMLPECGTEGAAAMKAKWQNRIPVSGRAFDGLDGYCELSSRRSEQEDEVVPFLMQANGGRVQGDAGVSQQYGLAAETARTAHQRIHFRAFFQRVSPKRRFSIPH